MVCAATTATAQVGFSPAKSPYRDLEYSQEVTAVFGYYWGREVPANVAPGNGLVTGIHWQWRAGGPAYLTSEITRIASSRFVLDPAKPPATRNLGEQSWPLYTATVGLSLGLTGSKSWHELVPEFKTGVGFVSDLKNSADIGDFKYGTRFAIMWGAAVRYVPGGRFQLRADLTNRLNTISYPDTYFRPSATGGPAILTGVEQKSVWRNNPSLTLGFSYLYSR